MEQSETVRIEIQDISWGCWSVWVWCGNDILVHGLPLSEQEANEMANWFQQRYGGEIVVRPGPAHSAS